MSHKIVTNRAELVVERNGSTFDVVLTEKDDGKAQASTWATFPLTEVLDAIANEANAHIIDKELLPPITQEDLNRETETYEFLMRQAKSFLAMALAIRTEEIGSIFKAVTALLPEAEKHEAYHLATGLFEQGVRMEQR